MPKVERCVLCGVDFIEGQERDTFVIDQPGVCSGTQWTTMRFPELPVGQKVECHNDCAMLWNLPVATVERERDV